MKIAKRTISFVIAASLLAASTALAGSDPGLYKLSKYKGYVGEKVKITGINFGKEKFNFGYG